MAFTEATLQAQLAAEGLNATIVRYEVGATYTDVYVENINSTSRKSGWARTTNSNTAADAAAEVTAALSA